jgi:hypothetical protein
LEIVVGRGNNTATWNIPRALLSHHSAVFRTAGELTSKDEKDTKKLLSDIPSISFQTFVQWLYFGTLPEMDNHSDLYFCGLALWILGDRLKAGGFKNCVMTKLHKMYSQPILDQDRLHAVDAELCWYFTTPGSSLRAFYMDVLFQHWVYATYISDNEGDWEEAFKLLPAMRDELFFAIAGADIHSGARPQIKPLSSYLEKSNKSD